MRARRLLLILAAALAGSLLVGTLADRHASRKISPRDVTASATISPLARALRPNYPYSVIPGGAYSPAELRAAISRDGQVRDHYSDFDAGNARVVTLTADRFQYVSFRLKDKILWTNRRLKIPRGEVLLTDGRHYARTRCGNRLSPVKPAVTVNGPDGLLALPPLDERQLASLPLASGPDLELTLPSRPMLPFQAPSFEPVLPGPGSPIVAGSPSPLISGFAGPGLPPSFGGTPSTPTQSPSHVERPPVSSLISPPPPGPMEVPEPATGLCLFILALASSVYALFRLGTRRRTDR